MRCAMTGQEHAEFSDGIWDDDEWISWDYINQQIYQQDRNTQFPGASPELLEMFERLVELATDYKELTGRYLPLFGELGELYAEIRFGIKRHRPMACGSDGKLGNDFVEVKTITPDKRVNNEVRVKRAGNFSKLVVVRISANFDFDARMMERRALKKDGKTHALVKWESMPE